MNKKSIVLFVFLIVFCIVLILNGTLFLINDISFIDYDTEKEYAFEEYDEEELLTALGIRYKMNIFTLSEKKATENFDNNISLLKLINIERIFPNKVKVTVLKRYPLYEINYNDNYYTLDREGVVINVSKEKTGATSVSGLEIKSITKGQFMTTENYAASRLTALGQACELYGYKDAYFTQIFERIDVNGYTFSLQTRTGVVIRFNVATNLKQKIREALSWYNSTVAETKRYSGTLTIYDDGQGGYLKPIYTKA